MHRGRVDARACGRQRRCATSPISVDVPPPLVGFGGVRSPAQGRCEDGRQHAPPWKVGIRRRRGAAPRLQFRPGARRASGSPRGGHGHGRVGHADESGAGARLRVTSAARLPARPPAASLSPTREPNLRQKHVGHHPSHHRRRCLSRDGMGPAKSEQRFRLPMRQVWSQVQPLSDRRGSGSSSVRGVQAPPVPRLRRHNMGVGRAEVGVVPRAVKAGHHSRAPPEP